jgi:hypothetical protein
MAAKARLYKNLLQLLNRATFAIVSNKITYYALEITLYK